MISWNVQKIYQFSEFKGCKFVFKNYSLKFFKSIYYFSDMVTVSKLLKIDTSVDDQDIIGTQITTSKKEIGAFLESIQLPEIHTILLRFITT